MKTTRYILAAVAAMSLLVGVAARAEWTEQDTKDCWEWTSASATRIVTSPRLKEADEEAGEGMLEAFGTTYMPNAYAVYQNARAKAKEREVALKENFPNGIKSDSTGGATYRKVAKATAKAISEMYRRHDELCHFYLLHKGGVMTADELAEKDQTKILMMLPLEEWDFPQDNLSTKQPSEAERTFAGKHLPDVLAAYDRLNALFGEGRGAFAELRKEAICLDAERSRDLVWIFHLRLKNLVAKLNEISDLVKQKKLLYDVEEISADDLAKLNQKTALKLQEYEKKYDIRAFMQAKIEVYWADDDFWTWQLPPAKQLVRQLVSIPDRNFKIGKYEVTQAQWESIMGNNPSRFKGNANPVEQVSWNDCQMFLEKLNALEEVKQSGLVFRLPTKEEWKYACRAGAKEEYCKLANGREITKETIGEVAWFHDNSEVEVKREYWLERQRQSHIVGMKIPNAFGLYDMYGNVAEWISTYSRDNNRRYVMGGSFDGFGSQINRDEEELVEKTDDTIGLRVVAEDSVDRSEIARKFDIDSNARVAAAESALEKMGIAVRVVTLTSGLQLLMNELPDKGHWMGAFEVTQAQWEAVMGNNPSEFKGGDLPVERVSWNDCQEFIEKLNALEEVKKSGLVFHLPTKKEWQDARRAGLKQEVRSGREIEMKGGFLFPDGTTIKNCDDVAWHGGNSGKQTHPVGQKKPNAFGLYDVLGNVREWATDEEEGWLTLGYGYGDNKMRIVNDILTPGARALFVMSESDVSADVGFRLAANEPKVIEVADAAESAAKAAEEAARVAALNRSVVAVIPTLKKMGVETMIIELPGGAQLLMNKLPNGKWIGAFEVTMTQWKSVMGKRASKWIRDSDDPIEFTYENELDSMSEIRDGCLEFLKKLNSLDAVRQSGLVFGLPTKEEWEYACRAGAKRNYCRLADGTEVTEKSFGEVAWYKGNSEMKRHPVGQKEPNAFGLYDMFGNLYELASFENRCFCGSSYLDGDYIHSKDSIFKDIDDCKFSRGFRLAAKKEAAE